MNPSLEELRESYFIAISKLTNEEDIRNSLPLSSSDNFEELINMIISKLDDEISEWEREDLLAVTNDDKETVKKEIKAGLEGLAGKIPGLKEIKVNINGLPSSNADLMLDSLFDDEASLKAYAVNPLHAAAADTKVRPFTKSRVCLDYEA